MGRKFWMMPLALLALLATGCQTAEEPSLSFSERSAAYLVANADSPNEVTDTAVDQVIDAINSEDAATLATYLVSRDDAAGVDHAQAAIADYQTYFMGSRLVGFQRVGATVSNSQDAVQYELLSELGLTKNIYVIPTEKKPLVYDEFLGYSGLAKAQLDAFVQALKNQDATQLAAAISTNGGYSTAAAASAIATYDNRFDLDTMQFEFSDLNAVAQEFTYRITGTKNGIAVEHYVTVSFADGINIRDRWLR
jgi:hypothetical protein